MSQSFYKLYYHVIWTTKDRQPIISPFVGALLKEVIPKTIQKYGGLYFVFNAVDDHVHLLTSIPPKISISEFVNKIKGSSSHHINISQNEKSFYWQSGFGILSLSEKGIPFVKQYIKNQKQHHKNNRNLINILESC